MLGLEQKEDIMSTFAVRHPRPILTTSRLNCIFCPAGDSNLVPTLRRRRRDKMQNVWFLDESFHWVEATLVVAHCASCLADYYPDRITYVSGEDRGSRLERLEYRTDFLRVSKHRIWVHRKIAIMQEKALHRFHSGWSNFADFVNDTTEDKERKLTNRQSTRLILEHFSRRLLISHGKDSTFSCEAHPSAIILAAGVRDVIGVEGGILASSMAQGCVSCTHVKRYRSDLIQEGAVLGTGTTVSEGAATPDDSNIDAAEVPQGLPANMQAVLPQQEAPQLGSPRGYIRMAVMDGKTIKHRVKMRLG
ncbi:hypothetical protein C8J57DRAFT_1532925 [Mycena rebaudengoi]|nr:hypothetical protein C8J57DRAFT_1532925 [Mycena rebaudengoi]